MYTPSCDYLPGMLVYLLCTHLSDFDRMATASAYLTGTVKGKYAWQAHCRVKHLRHVDARWRVLEGGLQVEHTRMELRFLEPQKSNHLLFQWWLERMPTEGRLIQLGGGEVVGKCGWQPNVAIGVGSARQ